MRAQKRGGTVYIGKYGPSLPGIDIDQCYLVGKYEKEGENSR
jgi:hypothetical protein